MNEMWLHAVNLALRSWHAMVAATGTTTLGFGIWTIALALVLWIAGFVAKYIHFKSARSWHPLAQAWNVSRQSATFSIVGIITLVLLVFGSFVIRTIYSDHATLVSERNALADDNSRLNKILEMRRNGIVTSDPVFPNTIYLLQAFDVFRREQKGRPCVILFSAPAQDRATASVVAQFSNSVSDCFTFGPMEPDIDPTVEKRSVTGMVPGAIVFHALKENHAADELFGRLGGLFPLKRSYDVPSLSERKSLYSIPNPGSEDLIWLQFGTGVKFNSAALSK